MSKVRKNTDDLLQMIDKGIVDPAHLIVSLLKRMPDSEVELFALEEGYFIDDEENDHSFDDDSESCGTEE